MKSIIKKQILIFSYFLLAVPYGLYAIGWRKELVAQEKLVANVVFPISKLKQLVDHYCRELKNNCVPKEIVRMITHFALPADLSGENLTGFDFTGFMFIGINLTDAILKGAILKNTVCDYQKLFDDSFTSSGSQFDQYSWYQRNLLNDLRNISQLYSRLTKDVDKAKLLSIACGIARLPYDIGTTYYSKFYINAKYWFGELLKLRKDLLDKKVLANQQELTLSLEEYIIGEVELCSWKLNCLQEVSQNGKKYPSFEKYLGKIQYGYDGIGRCPSANFYRIIITEVIQKLKDVCHAFKKEQRLHQKALILSRELSKSFDYQEWEFYDHFFLNQKKLVQLEEWLRKKLTSEEKQEVNFEFYTAGFTSIYPSVWGYGKSYLFQY